MENIKKFGAKLLSFLRVRMSAGGLEVSDQVLRLVYSESDGTHMVATVLGPGVVEKGIVKDEAAFEAALAALRAKIPALKSRQKTMNVVVALSSANIYTQSFSLPIMVGKELQRAIDLNIQMSSPDDLTQSYFGSEILRRDDEHVRLEISAAFIGKKVVDDLARLLFTKGFVTINVESRALALARLMREHVSGIDIDKSYILLDVDNTGIDFLVIRNGRLYFEYATPWMDIADEKGQVTMEQFTGTVSANLRQMMNFYHQHWQDALSGVVVSSIMFREETEKIIGEVSSLPVIQLTIVEGQPTSEEWFTALGASLRGAKAGVNDKEINLSGEGTADEYRKEQVLHFLDLWQVLVPAALGILVITLFLAYNFLTITQQQLASDVPFSQQSQQGAEIIALQASSSAFSQTIQLVLAAQSHADTSHLIFDRINKLAATSSVSVSRLAFQGGTTPISLSGIAPTEDDILRFKTLIEADPYFGPVSLPLEDVQPALSAFSFSMTFPLSPSAFQQRMAP